MPYEGATINEHFEHRRTIGLVEAEELLRLSDSQAKAWHFEVFVQNATRQPLQCLIVQRGHRLSFSGTTTVV